MTRESDPPRSLESGVRLIGRLDEVLDGVIGRLLSLTAERSEGARTG
jgi:hypothetical protein